MSDRPHSTACTAVIGAGVAGMSAARCLVDNGLSVVVFDKGRGPGGRAARRRQDIYQFDHGAQYFTVRDPIFANHVESWQQEGIVAEWRGRVVSLTPGREQPASQSARYVGIPGMSRVARHMGRDIEVHYGRCVELLDRRSAGWMLRFDDGTTAGPFVNLLATMPAPQTAELLASSCPDLASQARAARMLPCWTTMLAFDHRLEIGFDAAFVDRPGAIRWLARNSSKPDRPSAETWVVNARHDWSIENLERPHEWVASYMTKALRELIDSDAVPVLSVAHRWRYAFVDQPLGVPCLFDDDLRVGVAGDWCLGSRIEAAFCSGVSAAARIVGHESHVQ